jgi:hypothetical protein
MKPKQQCGQIWGKTHESAIPPPRGRHMSVGVRVRPKKHRLYDQYTDPLSCVADNLVFRTCGKQRLSSDCVTHLNDTVTDNSRCGKRVTTLLSDSVRVYPQSQEKHHLYVFMFVSSWPCRALNVIAKVSIPIPTQWRIFYRLLIGTWLPLLWESGLIQRGQKSLHTNLKYHEKLHMHALCLWYNVKLENGASQYRRSLACDCRV